MIKYEGVQECIGLSVHPPGSIPQGYFSFSQNSLPVSYKDLIEGSTVVYVVLVTHCRLSTLMIYVVQSSSHSFRRHHTRGSVCHLLGDFGHSDHRITNLP